MTPVLVVVVVYGVVNVLGFLQTPDGIALYAHLPVLLVLFIKGLVAPASHDPEQDPVGFRMPPW